MQRATVPPACCANDLDSRQFPVSATSPVTPVVPFFTEGLEGFSIDYPDEFAQAEAMIAGGTAFLPPITQEPMAGSDAVGDRLESRR